MDRCRKKTVSGGGEPIDRGGAGMHCRSDIQLSDAVYYAGDVLCTVSGRIICAEHARIVIEEYKGRHD